jgi:flavorubredoxin
MKGPFKAIKISEHVHWVGAIDWTIRDFHGYATKRGSTYNAYLVTGEKPILIDTVKAPFKHELLSRISSVIDPREIRYIISNHSEMDHSGCLPRIIKRIEPEKVYASAMGAKALAEHFGLENITPVKSGETLNLGGMNFSFLETRMLHWPDSMVSFLHEDNLLFSQDAFGMHLATSERFADEIDKCILLAEAAKYYANILLPYSNIIPAALKKVGETGFDIKIIAPDHGPIWRKDVMTLPNHYAEWAAQKPTMKAVVVYDTMWLSTDIMARAICDGLIHGGAEVKLLKLGASHRSDVATEILDAGALLVGSPTLNNGIFPTIADVLTYLKGLKPRNLIGAAFGSYGWSGESVGVIEKMLEEIGVELVSEGIKVKYVPRPDDLEKCFNLGILVARKLREICE